MAATPRSFVSWCAKSLSITIVSKPSRARRGAGPPQVVQAPRDERCGFASMEPSTIGQAKSQSEGPPALTARRHRGKIIVSWQKRTTGNGETPSIFGAGRGSGQLWHAPLAMELDTSAEILSQVCCATGSRHRSRLLQRRNYSANSFWSANRRCRASTGPQRDRTSWYRHNPLKALTWAKPFRTDSSKINNL